MVLNIGPQHPSTHGVLLLLVHLDGELIVNVEPIIGYLHRGIEKIAESRTYIQFIPYMDRLDYVSGMLNEWSYVMSVEQLLEVDVPRRAEYIRVIAGELNRVASHMVFTGPFLMDLGAISPMFFCMSDREKILDLFESLCGARMTFNFFRFGGVKCDLPAGFEEQCKSLIPDLRSKIDEYERLISENEIFLIRTRGVGVISPETATEFALSGPSARASGLPFDLRKVLPYSVYPEFDFEMPTGSNGDCFDRYMVRINEMRQSLKIVEQALEGLPDGKINSYVPRIIKPPKGEAYRPIEGSRGELGVYIISDGSPCPFRVKIREPSFVAAQTLATILPGNKLADLIAINGSIDLVMGGVDR